MDATQQSGSSLRGEDEEGGAPHGSIHLLRRPHGIQSGSEESTLPVGVFSILCYTGKHTKSHVAAVPSLASRTSRHRHCEMGEKTARKNNEDQ